MHLHPKGWLANRLGAVVEVGPGRNRHDQFEEWILDAVSERTGCDFALEVEPDDEPGFFPNYWGRRFCIRLTGREIRTLLGAVAGPSAVGSPDKYVACNVAQVAGTLWNGGTAEHVALQCVTPHAFRMWFTSVRRDCSWLGYACGVFLSALTCGCAGSRRREEYRVRLVRANAPGVEFTMFTPSPLMAKRPGRHWNIDR